MKTEKGWFWVIVILIFLFLVLVVGRYAGEKAIEHNDLDVYKQEASIPNFTPQKVEQGKDKG